MNAEMRALMREAAMHARTTAALDWDYLSADMIRVRLANRADALVQSANTRAILLGLVADTLNALTAHDWRRSNGAESPIRDQMISGELLAAADDSATDPSRMSLDGWHQTLRNAALRIGISTDTRGLLLHIGAGALNALAEWQRRQGLPRTAADLPPLPRRPVRAPLPYADN